MLGAEEAFAGLTGKGAVFFYSTLESITLPRTLKVIEKKAFAFCNKLKRIKFPEGIRFLGRNE